MSILGQVWLQAFCAAIAGQHYNETAISIANVAVEEYKKRFMTQKDRGPLVPR